MLKLRADQETHCIKCIRKLVCVNKWQDEILIDLLNDFYDEFGEVKRFE